LPSSPWWREKMMKDSEAMWEEILLRLGEVGAATTPASLDLR
jgi:hypothetical protein